MARPVHAMVLVKPKTLVPQEFPRPAIGPDEGLLRLEACGICGSDYEQYEGAQPPHEEAHEAELHAVLLLEDFAVLIAHRHHRAHVDLVEGRQHRSAVLHILQPARDGLA